MWILAKIEILKMWILWKMRFFRVEPQPRLFERSENKCGVERVCESVDKADDFPENFNSREREFPGNPRKIPGNPRILKLLYKLFKKSIFQSKSLFLTISYHFPHSYGVYQWKKYDFLQKLKIPKISNFSAFCQN